jgi:hypothetical protein
MRWVEQEPDRYLGAVAATADRRFRYRSRVGELLGRPGVEAAPPRSPRRPPPELLYRAGAVQPTDAAPPDAFRAVLAAVAPGAIGPGAVRAVPPRDDAAVGPTRLPAPDPDRTAGPPPGEVPIREVHIPGATVDARAPEPPGLPRPPMPPQSPGAARAEVRRPSPAVTDDEGLPERLPPAAPEGDTPGPPPIERALTCPADRRPSWPWPSAAPAGAGRTVATPLPQHAASSHLTTPRPKERGLPAPARPRRSAPPRPTASATTTSTVTPSADTTSGGPTSSPTSEPRARPFAAQTAERPPESAAPRSVQAVPSSMPPSMPSLQVRRAPQAEPAAPTAAAQARAATTQAVTPTMHRTPSVAAPVRVGRQVPTRAVGWWGRSALRRVGLRGPR